MQASLKKNEGYVCRKLLDKRKKIKPKFQVNDLVGVADWKRIFSKWDTTNWSLNYTKLQKVLTTQYRVITLII